MANVQPDQKEKADNKGAAVKPDPATLHTTDPQDHMEGPFSSPAKGTVEGIEGDGSEQDEEDDKG